jgi:hypothetical protein
MDYKAKIKKLKVEEGAKSVKLGLLAAGWVGVTLIMIACLIFLPQVKAAYLQMLIVYAVATILLSNMFFQITGDIKSSRERRISLREAIKAEKTLQEKSETFNAVYDGIMDELSARRKVASFYLEKFTPITESIWKANADKDDTIDIFTKEGHPTTLFITCPAQIRDLLVELHTSLDKVLKP